MSVVLLFFLASTAFAATPKPASNYFDICHVKDNFDECLKNTFNKMRSSLVKGIPDLHIHSIEPMFIPKIEMGDGRGNFKLHMIMKNLIIRGVSGYEIKSVKMDFDKKTLAFTNFFPKMDFEGEYFIDGQIIVLPVKGEGLVTFNFTDITIESAATTEDYMKDGKTYIRVKNYKMSIEPKFAQSYFTNLFNGDKQLGEATNKLLNQNWKDAYFSYRQLPENAFAQYFKAVVNQVFSFYPKDELFPL